MPSTATLQLAGSGIEGKVVNYDTGLVKYYGAQQMLGESQYLLTCYNNTGGGLAKGDLCYIDADQSGTPRLALADADAASTCTGALVMANETIGSASSGECVVFGWVTGLSSLTAGAKQYVSTTGGDITETAPSATGDIVRVVGYAMSTTEMFFNPGGSWVEVA
jgi:hypothetical protein